MGPLMQRYFLFLMLLPLAGCSTIVKGTTQAVSIQTPGVEGATCELFSPAVGTRSVTTPANIVLDKSQHSVQVTCSKECYTQGTGIIASNTEVMTAGNILVGGVVGLAVDASSGAMNNYNPTVQIAMTPVKGCKVKA